VQRFEHLLFTESNGKLLVSMRINVKNNPSCGMERVIVLTVYCFLACDRRSRLHMSNDKEQARHMQSQPSATVLQTSASVNMTKLLPNGHFTLVPNHLYRVSIQVKGWSPVAAAAAQAELGLSTTPYWSTLYDFATMRLELRDPPPNTLQVITAKEGIKLTHENQTLTWDFKAPEKKAGTRVQIRFAYAADAGGTYITHVNSVTVFGVIAAEE
jgi:hypothetical protein